MSHFANYQAQPVLGYYVPREGLSLNSRYQLTPHYFVQGNVTFDMVSSLSDSFDRGVNRGPGLSRRKGLGAGYTDDCTTLLVNYSDIYEDIGTGTLVHNQIFMVQLQLRTLGDAKYSSTTLCQWRAALDKSNNCRFDRS